MIAGCPTSRPSDLLAELGFEFPLAGGDRPTGAVTLGMVAPLLRRHLAADDPLHPYPALIDHPALAEQSLRGYLNGSIDAVLRVGRPDRRASLSGGGLQDELARHVRRGAADPR